MIANIDRKLVRHLFTTSLGRVASKFYHDANGAHYLVDDQDAPAEELVEGAEEVEIVMWEIADWFELATIDEQETFLMMAAWNVAHDLGLGHKARRELYDEYRAQYIK